MAGPWRMVLEGALYHLSARGAEGRAIVADDLDRRRLLETFITCLCLPGRRTSSGPCTGWGRPTPRAATGATAGAGISFRGGSSAFLSKRAPIFCGFHAPSTATPCGWGWSPSWPMTPGAATGPMPVGGERPGLVGDRADPLTVFGQGSSSGYEEIARRYAEEERRLFEDLPSRDGMGRAGVRRAAALHATFRGIEPEEAQKRAVPESLGERPM